MQARRDPFVVFYVGLAALINVLALAAFVAMLVSSSDGRQFGQWFPLSVATIHVCLATLAIVLVGIVSKLYESRPLLNIFMLGVVPSIAATTFLLSQFADLFEIGASCPTVPIRDYPLFVLDNLFGGFLGAGWEWAKPHAHELQTFDRRAGFFHRQMHSRVRRSARRLGAVGHRMGSVSGGRTADRKGTRTRYSAVDAARASRPCLVAKNGGLRHGRPICLRSPSGLPHRPKLHLDNARSSIRAPLLERFRFSVFHVVPARVSSDCYAHPRVHRDLSAAETLVAK
jgi:hypothetical protein